MHGAAESSGEAVVLCEQLAGQTVHKEVAGKLFNVVGVVVLFDDFIVFAVVELLHDFDELFVGKLLYGRKTLCDNLMVASVGTEDEVVDVEGVGLSYCGCFLTDCKVGGAG